MKKKNGFIVGLMQGNNHEYTINGVKYILETRFQENTVSADEKIEKYIKSNFAHLTALQSDTTMKPKYVCLTAGKED